ncbi:MAG: LD-carboxypeptidase [Paludibacteraceae bacterium]|nr:LD-carboxypeptidase [Paludibacteraceae bacterium]
MKHIRIISPSGAIDPVYIDGAAARLRSWGYQVSEGQYARGRWGRFSGTDAERLADLVEALTDPTVDYVLCSRGGYGLQRIIDRVPTALSTAKIVGFSDITELHQWSLVNGRVSLHGLMCKHLTELPEDSEIIRNWRRALEDQPLCYEVPSHPLNRVGEIEGTLVGGNLSVLYGLQGTAYGLTVLCPEGRDLQSRMDNARCTILFIEDIAERHYHIDRMMQNLRMSGVLARISGLVVGQFADCEDDAGMNESVYETIRRAVEEYDYPVLFDFPAGHVAENMPLWIGKPTTLKVSSSLCILQQ